VTITLNGERHELTEPMTVDALLASLEIDPRRVAVEHNRSIVRRPKYGEIVVDEGDTVEIVNFVGGG
jgi:thiamine biosynthesis protein ThiS